jgi:hypothetical protein
VARALQGGAFYGVTDLADLERLTGQPWKCFETPLKLRKEDALQAIPQYHVNVGSTPIAVAITP